MRNPSSQPDLANLFRFKVVDLNGDSGLSKDEIRFVLLAQIPIDEVVLEEELNKNFKRWDKNKDGVIRWAVFATPGKSPKLGGRHSVAAPDFRSLANTPRLCERVPARTASPPKRRA